MNLLLLLTLLIWQRAMQSSQRLLEVEDYTLISDPGYPVYRTSTIFTGSELSAIPLKAENKFLPDLNAIPKEVAQNDSKLSTQNFLFVLAKFGE